MLNKVWTKVSENKIAFVVWGAMAILGLYTILNQHYGVKEIGHWFESPNSYNVKYFVNVFPETDKGGFAAKNYRLPADVYVYKDGFGGDENTEGGAIYIEKAYWPNGGSISFDSSCEVKGFDEKSLCNPVGDEYQDEWFYIELTNTKVPI